MADAGNVGRDTRIIPDIILEFPAIKRLFVQRRPLRVSADNLAAKLHEILKKNPKKQNVSLSQNTLVNTLKQLNEKKLQIESLDQQILKLLIEDDSDDLQNLYETEYQHCEKYLEYLSSLVDEAEDFLQLAEKSRTPEKLNTKEEDEEAEVSTSTDPDDLIPEIIENPKMKKLYLQRRPLRQEARKMAEALQNLIDTFSKEQNETALQNHLVIFAKRAQEKKARLETLDERISDMILSDECEEINSLYDDEYKLCESYVDKMTAVIVQAEEYLKNPPSRRKEEAKEDIRKKEEAKEDIRKKEEAKEDIRKKEEAKQQFQPMVVDEEDEEEVTIRLAEEMRNKSRKVRDTNTQIEIYTPLQKTAVALAEDFLQLSEKSKTPEKLNTKEEDEEAEVSTSTDPDDLIPEIIENPKMKKLYLQRRPLRQEARKMGEALQNLIDTFSKEQNETALQNHLVIFAKRAQEKKARLETLDERISDMILSDECEEINSLYDDEYKLCESYVDKMTAVIVQAEEYLKNPPSRKKEEAKEDIRKKEEAKEDIRKKEEAKQQFQPMVVDEEDEEEEVTIRLAEEMRKKSRKVRDTNTQIEIYTPLQKTAVALGEVEKYEIGNKNVGIYQERSIMVLGATGTGKTTFINSMANFLFGVEASDPFRFKLITQEEEGAERSQSVTKKVTAYVLHETRLPFRLTVVDTPGYGDTDGIKADKHTTGLIKKLFESTDESGISRLDAIVLVVKASDTRLTAHQKHNFNSVFQLFGKNLAENIVVVATFSDASDPPVQKTLKDQGIEFKAFHKFNNSAFFAGPKDNPREKSAQEFYWDVGQEGFKAFFESLITMQPKSLSQSAEVLRKREALENYVQQLKRYVQSGICNLEQMRQEALILEQFEAQILANEEFEYTVDDEVVKTVRTPAGQYTTNCTSCNRTCHDSCAFKDDEDKAGCVAMGSDGHCNICPGKCYWDIHKNLPYLYVIEKVTVTKTHEDLRQKYAKAQGDRTDKEALLENLAQTFGEQQENVLKIERAINGAIAELHEIAHYPRFMTDVQYIENLIEAERSELKPGYEERIAHLSYQRDLASMMEQAQDPNFDPFTEYRDGKWTKFIEDFNNKYYQQKATRVRQQAIRQFNMMLHRKNLITGFLDAAEKMSRIQRQFIALALIVAVLTLHLSYGYGAELLCNFVGFLYPSYRTVTCNTFRRKNPIICLLVSYGYGAELLCNFIGFLYPAYRSVTCNTFRCSKEERIQLFVYWLIFAAFDVLEFFAALFLIVFPFYWFFKGAFLVWCFAPLPANGSDFLYHHVIHPHFAERFMRN
ncbi:unnamed protein product [Cyprideis torosa]|uniref:Uncharacterized protein n=1 Tax=Cyprideis torosa TaxID=163714 RepID=A0A7R8WKI8_9CRUS|nr:unnamed protein product [Cyprideis torosa]CAG0901396.1 unnamed protein product [Cyprideis torosa]